MFSWLGDFIDELFEKVLTFNPLLKLGCSIWNWCMRLVFALFHIQPTDIGDGEPWADLTVNIYPVFLAIGASLMCVFFLVGFCKESTDLRQSFTFEKSIMLFLRLVLTNIFLTTAIIWIPKLFSIAAGLSLSDFQATEFDAQELGAETGGIFSLGRLSVWFFSLIFCITAAVCGLLIVMTVYKRYIDLMLLVVIAPPALATWAGGGEIGRSASAWLRTFFSNCFDIVVISLALRIGCRIIADGRILNNIVENPSSEIAIFEMAFSMILLLSTVKGAEGLLRRAYAL